MSHLLLPQQANEQQCNSPWWWQHWGRTSPPCTWNRTWFLKPWHWSCFRWASPTKPIPQQKGLHFEATPSGPLYHEMDTSRHPRCTCAALTLQKFIQEPTEMVLAPHFVWTSTSISTGTLGPFLWGKMHFILGQNKSAGGSLDFCLCQRKTKFVLKPCWKLQKGKKETGYEQNQINIHLQARVACV